MGSRFHNNDDNSSENVNDDDMPLCQPIMTTSLLPSSYLPRSSASHTFRTETMALNASISSMLFENRVKSHRQTLNESILNPTEDNNDDNSSSLLSELGRYSNINKTYTHLSMGQTKGLYNIESNLRVKFMQQYCREVAAGNIFTIGETIHASKCLPVLVDYDAKRLWINDSDDECIRCYDSTTVDIVIQTYQSVLREILSEIDPLNLMVVVLEKEPYRITKDDKVYIKHGFHLHFPYLFMYGIEQSSYLIPRVVEILESQPEFIQPTVLGWEVQIDAAYVRSPWLMYGSTKNENLPLYKISRVVTDTFADITVDQAFAKHSFYDDDDNDITATLNPPLAKHVSYYLPWILSIYPLPLKHLRQVSSQVTLLALDNGSTNNNKSTKSLRPVKKNVNNSVIKEILLAKEYIPLIETANINHNRWMNVGWALFGLSDGSEGGLKLWTEFSGKCSSHNYSPDRCAIEWSKMYVGGKGLGSLIFMAQEDNPEQVNVIRAEMSKRMMEESLSVKGTCHYDVAKLLLHEYKNEFVCTNPETPLGSWYRFDGHRWKEDRLGVSLSIRMSEEIHEKFRIMFLRERNDAKNQQQAVTGNMSNIIDVSASSFDIEKPKQLTPSEKKQQHIQKIMTNLRMNPFKNSVMKEAKALFYDPYFLSRLDANKYLIGFQNGVYDFLNDEFRDGRPSDYLTKSMPINYTEYTLDDPAVQKVLHFFEQVFPNNNIRKYFFDTYSEIFVGGNHDKLIPVWTGEGDNAKSVTQKLFEKMLGKYAIKFDTSVVTGKKPGAGSANADLARAGGGIRFVAIEEPNAKEQLNVGTLKHLSGNDTCFARDLYEKGKDTTEINPLFKIAIICNDTPVVPDGDQAIWNRFRILLFEALFCIPEKGNIAPDTYEEQLRQKRFPAIKDFEDKHLPEMLEPFAWYLIYHRKNLKGAKFEPYEVRVATESYRRRNDTYRQFEDECIKKEPGAKIALTELYHRFKNWHKESCPHQATPTKEEVKKHLNKMWPTFSPKGAYWTDYRLRHDDDMNEEDIAITPVLNGRLTIDPDQREDINAAVPEFAIGDDEFYSASSNLQQPTPLIRPPCIVMEDSDSE